MTVGSEIIRVEAVDADIGANGDVHYRLKQDIAGHHRVFRIDEKTGVVYLRMPLDREVQKLYEVIIRFNSSKFEISRYELKSLCYARFSSLMFIF